MGIESPSLNIYRPVLNIGGEDLDNLRRSLIEEGKFPVGDIGRLFGGRELRSHIVSHKETAKTLYTAGYEGDFDEIECLQDYLEEKLPKSFGEPLTVPTLPAHVYDPKIKGRRELRIAYSPLLAEERIIALNSLSAYFDLNQPRAVKAVKQNLHLTATKIASSQNVRLRTPLTHLQLMLPGSSLPKQTELGPALINIKQLEK